MFTPAQQCPGQLQLQPEKGDAAAADRLEVRLSVILNFHFHVFNLVIFHCWHTWVWSHPALSTCCRKAVVGDWPRRGKGRKSDPALHRASPDCFVWAGVVFQGFCPFWHSRVTEGSQTQPQGCWGLRWWRTKSSKHTLKVFGFSESNRTLPWGQRGQGLASPLAASHHRCSLPSTTAAWCDQKTLLTLCPRDPVMPQARGIQWWKQLQPLTPEKFYYGTFDISAAWKDCDKTEDLKDFLKIRMLRIISPFYSFWFFFSPLD